MKVFVTVSYGDDLLRYSVILNPPAYAEKTFRQCVWAPDVVLEGMCAEDEHGNRILKDAVVVEGENHPYAQRIKDYLAGK